MNGLKRYWIPVVAFVVLVGSVWTAAPRAHAAAAQPAVSTLVAIRAAYHPEAKLRYDRVVFEFRGPVPQIDPHPGYVKQLTGDASGLPLPINGTAIFAITMRPAQAHKAPLELAPRGALCGRAIVWELAPRHRQATRLCHSR